ncbi:Methionyl-tRNA formyltransferase [Sarcoptes scabiei]|uniref:methionyl-tRNA formyltransferase n=1 Tax=Sarcoptes scabiei TaxID=52283 RepID=A0A834RJ40_SARSC|nr:Methionyl-tRNA formyltransferase [Sarcoptes scabiei]
MLQALFNQWSNQIRLKQSLLVKVLICSRFSTNHLTTKAATFSNSPKELSILFFGSDDFSVHSLSLLHRNFIDHDSSRKIIKELEIITTKEDNPVGLFCRRINQPFNLFDEFKKRDDLHYDLGIISSFGRMIPSKIIDSCQFGMLNVHGSLLPRWRGASPIQRAVLAGDSVTGITIIRIHSKKFDTGEILLQQPIEILHRISSLQLKKIMAPIGAKLVWQCLENLDFYLSNLKKQSEDGITNAPKIEKSDGEIDWKQMDSYEIDRRFRAFNGFIDVYTHWIDGTILKLGDILDPDLVNRLKISTLCGDNLHHKPGLIYYHKKRHILCVASANGTWSAFRSLTLKGRKKMSALGFSNTFIRPMIKKFKAENHGQRAFLVIGNDADQRGLFSIDQLDNHYNHKMISR